MKNTPDYWQYYCYVLVALLSCTAGGALAQDSDQLALPPRKGKVATASATGAGNSSAIQRIERSFSFYTHQEQQKKSADQPKPAARSSSSDDTAAKPVVKSVLVKKPSANTGTSVASKSSGETSEKSRSSSASSTREKTVSSARSSDAKEKQSSTSDEKKTARASEKTSTASSKSSESSAKNEKTVSSSSSSSRESDKESASRRADAEPRDSGAGEERESDAPAQTADANEQRGHHEEPLIAPEEVSGSPAQPRELAMVPGPVSSTGAHTRAPVTAPAAAAPANAYISHDTRQSRSLLSRILRREPATQVQNVAYAPMNFTSDYTRRSNDGNLPSAIRGNGINGRDIPIGLEDQFRFSTMPDDFRPTDLVEIPRALCHYNNQLYLRSEAANALCRMVNDAARQGLNIQVVSAFRDYQHQLRLYNQAVSRRGPNQKMVARPGRSEHQLGTTVDVTNSSEHSLKRSFGQTAEGRWLAANAERYGWKLTVMSPEGNRSTDEPWHLRYLGSQVGNYTKNRAIAQNRAAAPAQPQKRGLFQSVGRFFGSNRR